jgi:hypothetical protein
MTPETLAYILSRLPDDISMNEIMNSLGGFIDKEAVIPFRSLYLKYKPLLSTDEIETLRDMVARSLRYGPTNEILNAFTDALNS